MAKTSTDISANDSFNELIKSPALPPLPLPSIAHMPSALHHCSCAAPLFLTSQVPVRTAIVPSASKLGIGPQTQPRRPRRWPRWNERCNFVKPQSNFPSTPSTSLPHSGPPSKAAHLTLAPLSFRPSSLLPPEPLLSHLNTHLLKIRSFESAMRVVRAEHVISINTY